MFYPPTFCLEVEFYLFFLEVIMLSFDLLVIGIQTFFLVFFLFEIISIIYL